MYGRTTNSNADQARHTSNTIKTDGRPLDGHYTIQTTSNTSSTEAQCPPEGFGLFHSGVHRLTAGAGARQSWTHPKRGKVQRVNWRRGPGEKEGGKKGEGLDEGCTRGEGDRRRAGRRGRLGHEAEAARTKEAFPRDQTSRSTAPSCRSGPRISAMASSEPRCPLDLLCRQSHPTTSTRGDHAGGGSQQRGCLQRHGPNGLPIRDLRGMPFPKARGS